MKKILRTIFLILLALSFLPLAAENIQFVMPKMIYTGDTVEIRYIFHSDALLFSGDFSEKISASMALRTDHDFFKANEQKFAVKSASLEKINSEYTLTLSLIPWKTGFLQIPPFNLSSIVEFSMQDRGGMSVRRSVPFVVSLSPIEVKSLVAKNGNKSFMAESGPLVLPGTTALLALLGILSVIFFSVFLFTILHLPKVAKFIVDLSYIYSLKRTSRKAIKRLLALQKDSPKISSDKDFAEKLQHIIREFLSKRFSYNFSTVTTSRIYGIFSELCGGSLSGHQSQTIESLIEIFSRLDYLRFCEKAAFLEKFGSDEKHERIVLSENAIKLIEDFDKEEDDDSV